MPNLNNRIRSPFPSPSSIDHEAREVPYAPPAEQLFLEDPIKAAFLAANYSGRYAHVYTNEVFTNRSLREDYERLMALLPTDAIVERSLEYRFEWQAFIRTTEFVLRVCSFPGLLNFEVGARSRKLAKATFLTLRDRLAAPPPHEDALQITTWTKHGGPEDMDLKRIEWSEIAENYPDRTRTLLDRLMGVTKFTRPAGKVILLSGSTGTGKSYAIRALLSAWEPWCEADYLCDAEAAFSSPSYLRRLIAHVLPSSLTRMLICEDIDELVTERRSGALARLLNLTDGILGQDRDRLVLLTTNCSMGEIDPALQRAGRCMARIPFEKFDLVAAQQRIGGSNGKITGEMTLAELLQAEGTVSQIGPPRSRLSTGSYL